MASYKTKDRSIATPKVLWGLFVEYRECVKSNPILVEDFIRGGPRAGRKIVQKKERPLSWVSFEAWLGERGVIKKLDDYRYNSRGAYSDFEEVMQLIENIIVTDKFDGASVGIFNPVIISRDLGLTDKTETKSDINVKGDVTIDI